MTGSLRVLATALALGLLSIQATFPRSASCGASKSGKISIDANIDRDRAAPGEVLTLTVLVRSAGLNLPAVALPVIPGVTVERTGEAQNFSVVNGRMERTATIIYRLIPRYVGAIQIPPLRISAGGETASTSPLTITVTASGASPVPPSSRGSRAGPEARPSSGTPELFVRATVDPSRAFLNQQIILRLRLYSRVDLVGDVDWRAPATNGFWTEGLGPPRKSTTTMNGVTYDLLEIPTALFPTRAGTLSIGSAKVRCRVARVTPPPDPWSMLAQPDVIAQDVVLTTDPITVVVDPLPPGATSGFQGAVGDYRLSLRVDALTARAGEPIVARVAIRGTGNVASIRDPEVRARGAARQYVAGSSTRIDRGGDRLSGEREIDVAFVADQPGELEILPIQFSWFDPEGKRYRTQTSESVKIKVLPGEAEDAIPGRGRAPGDAIAALRPAPGPHGGLSLDPTADSAAILSLSALAFGAAVVAGRARQRRFRDPHLVRVRTLETLVERDMAGALALASGKEPARAATLAEQALLAGIGLRYDTEVTGLAREERRHELRARRAGDAEIASVEALFDSLAAIAYAPPETRSSDARQAIGEARKTLERYRRELLSETSAS